MCRMNTCAYYRYLVVAIPLSSCVTTAPGANTQPGALKLTPSISAGPASRPAAKKKMHFEGFEYDILQGLAVAMGVLRNEENNVDRRCKAARSVRMIIHQLKDRSVVEDLMRLYPKVHELDLRIELVRCVVRSDNPSCLRFLHGILESDDPQVVQYFAAYGLARWNVRQGVSALTELLDANDPRVANGAFRFLNGLTRRKGWGFPRQEVEAELASMVGESRDRKMDHWRLRWRAWFEENKHRFPEWKPPGKEKEKAQQQVPDPN